MLTLQDVTKDVKDATVLRGIDISIKAGEMVGIFGQNGAGKSTLLKLATGLWTPTSGTVTIDGLSPRSAKARAKTGCVYQEPALDAFLTPRSVLRLHAGLCGLSGQTGETWCQRAADAVDISHLLDRRISRLSGGQRRRVELARALLPPIQVLILDEPTTGLDPATKSRFWHAVSDSQLHGSIAVLLSTHDYAEIQKCTRAFQLTGGMLVEYTGLAEKRFEELFA